MLNFDFEKLPRNRAPERLASLFALRPAKIQTATFIAKHGENLHIPNGLIYLLRSALLIAGALSLMAGGYLSVRYYTVVETHFGHFAIPIAVLQVAALMFLSLVWLAFAWMFKGAIAEDNYRPRFDWPHGLYMLADALVFRDHTITQISRVSISRIQLESEKGIIIFRHGDTPLTIQGKFEIAGNKLLHLLQHWQYQRLERVLPITAESRHIFLNQFARHMNREEMHACLEESLRLDQSDRALRFRLEFEKACVFETIDPSGHALRGGPDPEFTVWKQTGRITEFRVTIPFFKPGPRLMAKLGYYWAVKFKYGSLLSPTEEELREARKHFFPENPKRR